MKKDCYNCAYCQDVPGSAHKACSFYWFSDKNGLTPPLPDIVGVKNGWYFFPINYDPHWQTEECKGFSEKLDAEKTVDPITQFPQAMMLRAIYLSILKKRHEK